MPVRTGSYRLRRVDAGFEELIKQICSAPGRRAAVRAIEILLMARTEGSLTFPADGICAVVGVSEPAGL